MPVCIFCKSAKVVLRGPAFAGTKTTRKIDPQRQLNTQAPPLQTVVPPVTQVPQPACQLPARGITSLHSVLSKAISGDRVNFTLLGYEPVPDAHLAR